MEILITLLTGAVAGWLGSLIVRGSGFGLIGNIVIGILGSFAGTWVLGKLNYTFGGGFMGQVLTGAVGAVVILIVARIIFPPKT
jgi:uncharacterized membrane protein YeaQ/YmgE (transglycosylase-associated protein family)